MEYDFIGYLLHLDEPEAVHQLEMALRNDPALAARLAAAAQSLAPLQADSEAPSPPADIVARTIGCVAQHIVAASQIVSAEPIDGPPVGEMLQRMTPTRLHALVEVMDRSAAGAASRRRPDVAVAATLLVLLLGVVVAAVPYWRHRQNVAACQNRMREFHQALQSYADQHSGRFPQVAETPPHNTAGSFVIMLREAGMLPASGNLSCPAAGADGPAVYAYSLGYREEGQLHGLRLDPGSLNNDLLPIMADRPPPSRIGVNPDHGTGQNVLYVGGHVNFCKTAAVGINGDDIYRNAKGEVGAGLFRWDTVLGVANDVP